jgi:hypothetical protein
MAPVISTAAIPAPAGPAETLYSQLRTVDLDPTRVYSVREASLDRSELHFSLESGAIAFTRDVYGRVTGAFFEGDGEVLLTPPNKVERASLALFTGTAILEEHFVTAYFRFDDTTFDDLRPYLRPSERAPEFIAERNETARHLADSDALRLFMSFSSLLPLTSTPTANPTPPRKDTFFHALVQGRQLGAFDLYYDSASPEPVWAGQSKTSAGVIYYDTWVSFAPGPTGQARAPSLRRADDVFARQLTVRSTVSPPTRLESDARLDLEVRRGGQRAVLFELSRFLQVKSVDSAGHSLEFIHNQSLEGTQISRRGNDLVAVVFPEPLQTGQQLTVHFVYGGDVLSEAGKGLLYVGARGTWYPNRGLTPAQFDLEFHYPAEWTLLATGKRVSAPAARPAVTVAGEQVSRWVTERPIPVAGFNLGKYTRAAARAGNVTVESYATQGMERTFAKQEAPPMPLPGEALPGLAPATVPPLIVLPGPDPSPARDAQAVADKTARAVDFFDRLYGPFPYDSLALTQMPGDLSQGWPGLVFLSSFAFLSPEEKTQLHVDRIDSIQSGLTLVHESAHQWWGDLITWADYRDQWVSEALADYSALTLLESEKPADFQAVLEKYRLDLLRRNKDDQVLKDAGPVTLGTRLSSSRFPDGYEAISYGRGVWLLHMLHHMLLDAESSGQRPTSPRAKRPAQSEADPFFRGLLKARQRFENKPMSARDLLRVFEEDLPSSLCYEGRKSLDWFFDGWISGTSLPVYQARGVSFTTKGSNVLVAGTLLQKDAPDDLVTPVPIYGMVGGRSILLGRVFADGPETQFRLTAPAGTQKVMVDPHQTLLTASSR